LFSVILLIHYVFIGQSIEGGSQKLGTVSVTTNDSLKGLYHDSFLVSINDSLVGMFQKTQKNMKIVIKSEWSQNGENPYTRKDSTKYKLHSIRELDLTYDGWITDMYIDSIKSIGYCEKDGIFIKNDSIQLFKYFGMYGGMASGCLFVKGVCESEASRRAHYNTVSLPGVYYKYQYDSLERIVSIIDLKHNSILFCKKYNNDGSWVEIKYKDLIIKKHNETDKRSSK